MGHRAAQPLGFLTVLLLATAAACGYAGEVVANIPVDAGRLELHPTQPWLYASQPELNSVAMIDTRTFQVIKTTPVGSIPAGMAVSPSGDRLYVANAGGSSISVLDAATLAPIKSISTPHAPTDLECVRDDLLYLTHDLGVRSLNPLSGGGGNNYGGAGDEIELAPDRRFLYYSSFLSTSKLDVTGSAPVTVATMAGGGGLVVSHDGQTLLAGGAFLHASDLTPTGTGGYVNGVIAAFSPDDEIVYYGESSFHAVRGRNVLTGGEDYFSTMAAVNAVVTDHSGRYLFASMSSLFNWYTPDVARVAVIDTGRSVPEPTGATAVAACLMLAWCRRPRRGVR